MNVLVLYEYRESSANFNISLKIINELQNQGITVFHNYFFNDKVSNTDETIDKVLSNSIHSNSSYYYLMHKFDDDWAWKPFSDKVIYLIKNPKFLCSYLSYKFDYLTRFKGGRKRIEALCLAKGIDIILGISAPHEIEFVLSDIKYKVPKFVFRLDPYAYNPCLPESKFGKRIKAEHEVLSHIDRLFTTRLIIRDLLTDIAFKQYYSKFIVIEFPLISENDKCKNTTESKRHLFSKIAGKIYLLHAGYFYRDIRNPGKLVDFLKELPEEYILVVAGFNSYTIRDYDSDIRDRIIDLGCLSRADVDSVIEDCDFLITYNNLNTNMIPSKLFECIDCGKPFINLCHTNKCPTIEYVKGYNMAYTVVLDQPIQENELIKFLENNKGKKSSREQILKRYRKCTASYVVSQLLEEIC